MTLPHCVVDLVRLRVHRDGAPTASLTPREAALLAFLVEHTGMVVSREQLLTEVWDYADTVISRATDNTVRRLRTKIEPDPGAPIYLITVHGSGYRWVSHHGAAQTKPPAAPSTPPLRLGDRDLDLERHVIVAGGQTTRLTGIEATLLQILVEAGGKVVDRQTLLRNTCGASRSRRLDSTIYRLRIKLEADPRQPRHLLTVRGRGYRLETPPLSTVPDAHAPLLGRDTDLEQVRRALQRASMVVVTGPVGVGKSRLAQSVASAWRGRAWRVDASDATTSDQLEALVAQALGVGDGEPQPADGVGTELARRGSALLVLDNLDRSYPQVGPLLEAWRRVAPRLRLLVTSRVRIGSTDLRVVELGPLDADSAADLFVRRVRAISGGFEVGPSDRPHVQALVKALDGLPLAIDLAAERVPVLSVEQLLQRLSRGLDLLSRSHGSRRHRSLASALDSSLDLLSEPQREALLLLCRLRGGFSIEDAEALLGHDATDRIQGLRNHSLLVHRPSDRHRPFRFLQVVQRLAEGPRGTSSGAGGGGSGDPDR